MTNETNRYFVICKDDNGDYVFATRRFFTSAETASAYADSIPTKRKPICIKGGTMLLAQQIDDKVGVHGEYKEWMNDKYAKQPTTLN